MTKLELDKSIVITEAYVDADDIVAKEDALEAITKEHEKKKVYKVEQGDIPQTIAAKNNMTTEKLYELNEGLRENATRIQIGQELVVMVPEPEIKVSTEEDVIYTKKIKHENDYVNNSKEYVGTHSVINKGSDGLLEVRAKVKKINGKIVETNVYSENVIIEAKRGTLSRGTKRLPITTATGTFEFPLIHYRLTSPFGRRWGKFHKGVDLANRTGTPILASDGGRVVYAGWKNSYGKCVDISHGNGYMTRYAHCSKIYVEVGDDVGQYQTIAAVGNTGRSFGPHVHFEIRKNGVARNPMDYLR